MNNTFSFRRLWLLARKHYSENRRPYLIGVACYAFVLFICFWCWLGGEVEDDFLMEFAFMWSAIFIPVVVAKINFSDSMKRGSSQIYYSLPATEGEKFLFALLNTLVVSAVGIAVCEVCASLLHDATPPRPDRIGGDYSAIGHWFANLGDMIVIALLFMSGSVVACSASKDKSGTGFAFVMSALAVLFFLPELFIAPQGDYLISTEGFIVGGNTLYCDYATAGGLDVWFLTPPVLPFHEWYNAIVPALLVVIGWFKFREREIS